MKIETIILLIENLTGIRKFENMTWSQLINYLKSQGFSYYVGADTHVFVHPQKDYVYKIISSNSGNMRFIELALKYQNNAFVPKIKSVPRLIPLIHTRFLNAQNQAYIVKMEKLFPLNTEAREFVFQACNCILARLTGQKTFNPYQNPIDTEATSEMDDFANKEGNEISIESFFNKYRKYKAAEFIQFIEQVVEESGEDVFMDVHIDNIMMRKDGTLVVIDPLFKGNERGVHDYSRDPQDTDIIKKGRG